MLSNVALGSVHDALVMPDTEEMKSCTSSTCSQLDGIYLPIVEWASSECPKGESLLVLANGATPTHAPAPYGTAMVAVMHDDHGDAGHGLAGLHGPGAGQHRPTGRVMRDLSTG